MWMDSHRLKKFWLACFKTNSTTGYVITGMLTAFCTPIARLAALFRRKHILTTDVNGTWLLVAVAAFAADYESGLRSVDTSLDVVIVRTTKKVYCQQYNSIQWLWTPTTNISYSKYDQLQWTKTISRLKGYTFWSYIPPASAMPDERVRLACVEWV